MEALPPSCIGPAVAAAPPELTKLIQSSFGPNTTVFALRCSCGKDHFGVSLPADGFGPVSVKCASCNSERTIFDPLKHGYDGALGNNEGREAEPSAIGCCRGCGLGAFELATGFQYSGETDVLEDGDLDIKAEDLFGWFVLGGRCASCGEASILIDIECA